MSAVVVVEKLCKNFGAVVAVRDVSLAIAPGQIYGLLGPNGAGKTTTLRCVATLTQPDSGRVEVAGTSDPRLIRERIGYVAQEVALDKVLTGRELLQFQAGLYHIPGPKQKERITQVLALLNLEEYADRRTGTYSGGLKKRLDLAAGLLHQPQVLILDEPTVGLDIQTRLAVWSFLRQIRQEGITVLITSHYLEEIDALADRVAIIDRGQVIAEGSPEELKSQVGGDRITVRIREFAEREEAEQSLTVLKNLPMVRSGLINSAQGNAINLVVDNASQGVSAIQECLAVAQIPLFSFSLSRPSLDDVFLAATGLTLLDADLAEAEQRR
ncbi:MAG: ATP-binding cassette domain-containing protein [Oscillatoriales cyanobacterium SM2_2_1]|nr:ATP-binding cassette domain-containing protein [Oscillatoriales cyanobacterium SM2_2_1]